MISGAHVILYSTDAEADRTFFRDVLKFPWVDAGEGWLIFTLPPAELAVHPAEENGSHELFLACDDLDATIATLQRRGVPCSPVARQEWGRTSQIILPGGGKITLYQPTHPRASR
jgi:catechol 2,3-dioxygenase-like lactoylglutathione lyase family enzyme